MYTHGNRKKLFPVGENASFSVEEKTGKSGRERDRGYTDDIFVDRVAIESPHYPRTIIATSNVYVYVYVLCPCE